MERKTLDATADITVDEGVDATNFVQSARAELNNVMEIFYKATSVSGTAQASKKASEDLFASEINDRLIELAIGMEKNLSMVQRTMVLLVNVKWMVF